MSSILTYGAAPFVLTAAVSGFIGCSPGYPRPTDHPKTGVLVASLLRMAELHVDDDAPPGGDGTGWDTAFRYLQDALAVAASGDEIRVAGGLYRPDQDEAGGVAPGDRAASFWLINGVAVRGGYAGLADPADPDRRDLSAYETVLSGDLAGDGGPGFVNNGENSFHVVTGSGTGSTAVLDGCTITAGNADGPALGDWDRGGGLYNNAGSPTLTHCTFRWNSAAVHGGGAYGKGGSSPMLVQTTFLENASATWGGGMYNVNGSSPALINCTLSGNTAVDDGGGMYNILGSNATLTNCLFSGNVSGDNGGGMYNQSSAPVAVNCTFSGNSADDDGGGLYNTSDGRPTLINCILWGNTADAGAQIFGGDPTVRYSCVQGGWPGPGNTAEDPLFIDAVGPDGTPGSDDDDLRLRPGSPSIDAGSNGAVPPDIADLDDDGDTQERTPLDLDLDRRFVDDPGTAQTGVPDLPDYPAIVDMGAYEFAQDCNTNGIFDQQDVASGTSGDCNGNGVPDECDIAAGTSGDCNSNGIADECDLAGGTSTDCNSNGLPDECDIAAGTSGDCNTNGVPDECELEGHDCNRNEVPDSCDMNGGTSADCNADTVPDECEVAAGTSADCNSNGVPDECEIAAGSSEDCNRNGVPDACDVALGTSDDADGNGVPDECELAPTVTAALDIKPGSCPNPVNPWSRGVLPVVLLGSADFDATAIDVATVRLSRADGVGSAAAPHEGPPGPHSVFADVAAPFDGEPCACRALPNDGIIDLSMKFQTEALVEVLRLDQAPPGTVLELVATGRLVDGTPFEARDCITIVG